MNGWARQFHICRKWCKRGSLTGRNNRHAEFVHHRHERPACPWVNILWMTITNNASLFPKWISNILLQLARRVSGRRFEKKKRTKLKKENTRGRVLDFYSYFRQSNLLIKKWISQRFMKEKMNTLLYYFFENPV
jgi:hypothetical protein